MRSWIFVAASLSVLLCGCTPASPDTDAPASAGTAPTSGHAAAPARPAGGTGVAHFKSTAYGLRIDYPSDMSMHEDFQHGYLQNGAWKAYANPDSEGHPIVALVLPGSNDVTAGELRIGASRDPQSVKHCLEPPASVRGKVGTREVNGARFTYFEASDAAMSHYLHTHSYRLVHDGACVAIDLLVTGTNPHVYAKPPTPPFTRDAAFSRLQRALRGFHFTL